MTSQTLRLTLGETLSHTLALSSPPPLLQVLDCYANTVYPSALDPQGLHKRLYTNPWRAAEQAYNDPKQAHYVSSAAAVH